jgi:hypothetical protein
MIAQPFTGAGYLLRGLRLIRERAILPYVAVPLAINVIVFATLAWYAFCSLGPLVDRAVPRLAARGARGRVGAVLRLHAAGQRDRRAVQRAAVGGG